MSKLRGYKTSREGRKWRDKTAAIPRLKCSNIYIAPLSCKLSVLKTTILPSDKSLLSVQPELRLTSHWWLKHFLGWWPMLAVSMIWPVAMMLSVTLYVDWTLLWHCLTFWHRHCWPRTFIACSLTICWSDIKIISEYHPRQDPGSNYELGGWVNYQMVASKLQPAKYVVKPFSHSPSLCPFHLLALINMFDERSNCCGESVD